MINGKKICGIGIRADQYGNHHIFHYINFGVNINMPLEVCRTINQPATSLSVERGRNFDKNQIFDELVNRFQQNVKTLCTEGFTPTFYPYLQKHTAYIGQEVIHTKHEGRTIEGIFQGFDSDGNAFVSVNGIQESLYTGKIRLKHPAIPDVEAFPAEEPKPTVLVTPVQEDVTLKREGVTVHESPKRQRVEAFPEEPQKPKILVTPPIKNVSAHVLTKEQFDFHLLRKSENGEMDASYPSIYWGKSKVFEGTKVYQHRSIIDPDQVHEIKQKTNLELMKSGKAPLGPDGNPINLHHLLQTHDGPVAEVTQTFHQQYYKALHINVGSKYPSGIDQNEFKKWKRKYWKNRAKDFEDVES